jgi:hypothetical protein
MNHVQPTFEHSFVQALRCLPGETAATESAALYLQEPAFAVYRNTVGKGCIDALEANYPTVARLVGSDWFRSVAALFVSAAPPSDSRLLVYGAGFADFLANFAPAAELPYLPGVARLDRFWTQAHVAADAHALDGSALTALTPERLANLVLRPHPAAHWAWFDAMPVYTIWQRNRSTEFTSEDNDIPWQAEGALITRPLDDVHWCQLDPAGVAFLEACNIASGCTLAQAAAATLATEPDADLSQLLAQLLRSGALVSAKS